jgi:SSS family transporter
MTSLAIEWAVVVLGLTTIAYTFYGGMRSVLWTDVVQFLLYVTGAMVALGLILRGLPGGWGQLVTMAAPAGKLHLLDLGFHWDDATNLWAGLIGGAFIAMGSHGVDQMMVQRYLAARHLRDTRRALTTSGIVVVLQFALFLIIGVGLWAFYSLSPPAVPFDRPDRVFARFILEQMPVGLLGLLLGAIFAAAMSTLSSSLNSCATAAADDLWRPWAGARSTETRELRVTRLLVGFFGAAQIAVGIGGRWLTESVINSILGIVAFTTGIVLGVFFLGIFTPRVGQRAALVGLVAGMAGMTWVYFATPLAWPWYALVGSAATVVAGLAASFVWPREPSRRGEGELPV